MNPLNLIFALHSHQPVGNFNFVFEEAYQKAYSPFLEVLKDFRDIHITLHITGPIWDWLDNNHPEFYDLVGYFVENGQIELMGGAFYEPLICAIPEEDALNQILYMQKFFYERFGKKTRGMWIAERVWEPYFPKILAQAGIEYTALDDTHFLCAGLEPNDMFGYYLTEHEGFIVKVFPILEKLRYTIPFRPIVETIDYLKEKSKLHKNACAVFHDDGEKFGIWPGTYHSVYEEKWLYNFFETVTNEKKWLKAISYSEYIDNNPPIGRVYLPCASYHEMMEWVLPTKSQKEYMKIKKDFQSNAELWEKTSRYFRGGFWRGFLSKYEESNNMQKRMLRTSRRLTELINKDQGNVLLKEAQRKLFQGQCNCAYWHGVFGGLYLNHLRTAVYSNLIESDKLIDKYLNISSNSYSITTTDFNCDGKKEIIFETSVASFYFSPEDGGTLFEMDYKPKSFNCMNTLSRREEAYHEDLSRMDISHDIEEEGHKSIHELIKAKEKGLEKYLIYDSYIRSSMRDHFLPLNISIEDLRKNNYTEWWSLNKGIYTYQYDGSEISFLGEGNVAIGDLKWNVDVKKVFVPSLQKYENDMLFDVKYCIKNNSHGEFEGYFGSEWCFNLLTGSADDRFLYSRDKVLSMRKLG
ncbi:MAG: alpha-amylase/4-alpha-glucanotransferase domain-containing protein, partial [Candidatus Hydrogenedens sp.]